MSMHIRLPRRATSHFDGLLLPTAQDQPTADEGITRGVEEGDLLVREDA